MTRDERRYIEYIKDKRRRKLYVNGTINGRYEVTGEPLTPPEGFADLKWTRKTLNSWNDEHVKLIKSGEGYWQQYPKTKYYGSKGYSKGCRSVKDIREEESHNYED